MSNLWTPTGVFLGEPSRSSPLLMDLPSSRGEKEILWLSSSPRMWRGISNFELKFQNSTAFYFIEIINYLITNRLDMNSLHTSIRKTYELWRVPRFKTT